MSTFVEHTEPRWVGPAASTPKEGASAAARRASLAKRVAVFGYGVASYVLSLGVFAYTAGFIGNFLTPTALDRPRAAGAPPWGEALAIDVGLLVLFAVQHSVMARPWFKARWTRLVPEAAERSTYVLASCIGMAAIFAWWQPLGGTVWDVAVPGVRTGLYALMGIGWALLLYATFVINHFDLFGLRQVWLYLLGRPYTHLPFKTPVLYRIVRHPLYVGWLTIFWATPTMTASHLAFAVVTTAYILAAIRWEERDLVDLYGTRYAEYRERVPKLIPSLGGER